MACATRLNVRLGFIVFNSRAAAAACILAIPLLLTACASEDGLPGEPLTPPDGTTVQPTAPQPSASPTEAEEITQPGENIGLASFDRLFTTQVEIPEDVAEHMGGRDIAEHGVDFAMGIAKATAFDYVMWEKVNSGGKLTQEDYLWFARYLTNEGKAKWFESTANRNLYTEKGPGGIIILPTVDPDMVWPSIPIRPSGLSDEEGKLVPASWIDVGGVSSAGFEESNDYPRMLVQLVDRHVYDFQDAQGKWKATGVERPLNLLVAYRGPNSTDPDVEWLLEDWSVGEVKFGKADPVPQGDPIEEPTEAPAVAE